MWTDAKADILVRGLFLALQDAYLDVAVLDTGADCHVLRKALSCLRDKQTQKRGRYEERVESKGGAFAPLVCSVYGTLAPEAEAILSLVVKGLDKDRDEKRSTLAWERIALQVGIVKAVSLCLRGRSQFTTFHDESEEPVALEDCQWALAESRPPAEAELVALPSAVAA